jgi:hypothetical protein
VDIRTKIAVTTVALLAIVSTSCSRSNSNDLGPPPSISPTGNGPPVSSPPAQSASQSDSPQPTDSGATGTSSASVSPMRGAASVVVTGGANATVGFEGMASPTVWSLPPGSIALEWTGPSGQFLALSGPAFTSRMQTSPSLSLSFSVHGIVSGSSVPLTFTSTNGECFVTITSAFATHMSGTFDCSNLPDASGGVVVGATGTFSATG